MNSKKSLIVSLLPLTPVLSGMQNTIYLLYKFLKKVNRKVIFLEVKTYNKIDPIINLKHSFLFAKKLDNEIKNYKPDFIFVNTSKILKTYKEIFLDKKRPFKTILVNHDLYNFRKKYFDKIGVKDSTCLKKTKEIEILKRTNYIIDYSNQERRYLLNSGVKKKQLINTKTPTSKFKNSYSTNAKYDILYISSDWLQNIININWIKKKLKINKSELKFLVMGNKKKLKEGIEEKNLTIKQYSKKSFNLAKLGLAIFNSGTGRKTKIFEMLSAGLPVVSNLDLSEFGLKNNEHYLRIYKTRNIHKTIIKSLNDFKLRKKLSKNAFIWSKKNTFYSQAFKNLKVILK